MSEGAAAKRLQQELMAVMMSQDKDCSAFPSDENLFEWTATITGSPETVYEGLVYKLRIAFGPDYPFKAPKVTFTTPCWHPNVDEHGNICLDILKDKWSAAFSVTTILQSLRSLLSDPNNDSPLNVQAAQLWASQQHYKSVLLEKYSEAKAAAGG